MVHLTIVVSLSIKAAMAQLIRNERLLVVDSNWTQINETIAGSALIRLRHTAAILTLQTNSSAASVVAATGRSLSVSPASLKSLTPPLRADAIWKADRKQESSDRACVVPLGTLPFQRPPLTQRGRNTLSAPAAAPGFVWRPQSGPGCCERIVFSCMQTSSFIHSKQRH